VDVRPGIQASRGAHKAVHKLVVLATPDASLTETKVHVVVEEGLVVGAAVEHHGQTATGMDTRAEGGEDQLGDGDENAADALVAYAEYFLAIYASSIPTGWR
jgi:hypothetical protein